MDFVRYAESSAALLNASLTDRDSLVDFLAGRAWLQGQVTDRDVVVLRRFGKDLRRAFEASSREDAQGVVDVLNELLERHPITPRIADHNPARLHIHVANKAASVAELLIGESLLGLANLVCDLGPTRLGVCAASPCANVYVDTSPNQSRRYCSERCSSRANVAAFRARQKAAAG
ncbi:MAG TPA: CGNR zinc finger domain-containing protein [Nocardioides sp.]|uniref:CGNR zinc finger domain-containing protein n=1 Tax=Nocardioides sp. TaxID=35761 RepID=UPI002E33BDB6|nr:CGNR zinc finger domain-containing protein [Nocardioides sp.]HEX3929982.1 CGNR zinc finger domain-containing protein [Nocardioides sp.]